jgi:hypothetical protein
MVGDKIGVFCCVALNNDIIEFIYCGCGCQKTRPKYNEKIRVMRLIAGHQNRGKNHPWYGK